MVRDENGGPKQKIGGRTVDFVGPRANDKRNIHRLAGRNENDGCEDTAGDSEIFHGANVAPRDAGGRFSAPVTIATSLEVRGRKGCCNSNALADQRCD